jgi:hypothetical protein
MSTYTTNLSSTNWSIKRISERLDMLKADLESGDTTRALGQALDILDTATNLVERTRELRDSARGVANV